MGFHPGIAAFTTRGSAVDLSRGRQRPDRRAEEIIGGYDFEGGGESAPSAKPISAAASGAMGWGEVSVYHCHRCPLKSCVAAPSLFQLHRQK